MLKEIWKGIKGYAGYYQISNLGRIKSLDRIVPRTRNGKKFKKFVKGKILDKGNITKQSRYYRVTLSKNNRLWRRSISRLVAETFIPNPKNKSEVNYKNGNREDNQIGNLEWVSHKENMQHAHRNNLVIVAKGINCVQAKLSEKDVLFIRKRSLSVKNLVKKFKMDKTTIYDILNRKTWKHI